LAEELKSVWNRLMAAIGFESWRTRALAAMTIGDMMHRDVRGIPASATYQRVVDFIERSHDNMLPVVDEDGTVVGMISYADLRDEHFDPGLGPLVRATDLALTSFPHLHPDLPATDAWREFKQNNADCLPVVTPDRPYRLLGIVRRRDLQQLSKSPSAASLKTKQP
jgi:CBS domain-containing protein